MKTYQLRWIVTGEVTDEIQAKNINEARDLFADLHGKGGMRGKRVMEAPEKEITEITSGPFTWVYAGDRGGETWDLIRFDEARMTRWSLKNYGGAPGPGFHGWKLVSGGPFDSAGAYSCLSEAAEGIVDFLIGFIRQEANEKMQEARDMQAILDHYLLKLNGEKA